MSWPLVILGIVLFIGLVVVHELGHFIAARRNGVDVEEFGIGFPPKAKTLAVKNGTEYTLNWLPLGGFVRLKGEHDAAEGPGSYGAANLWVKVKILLAGVVMNAVTAFVLLTLLAAIGMPKVIENQFTVESDTKVVKQEVVAAFIEEGSPADQAGLQEQDVITSFTGPEGQVFDIQEAENLPDITERFAGQQITVEYMHGGEEQQTTATLRTEQEVEQSKNEEGIPQKGYLGVIPSEFVVQRSAWSAPVVAAGLMKQVTELTMKGLGTALAGLAQGDTDKASSQVAGVVGVGYILTKGSMLGLLFILFIIAILSLTLAIMNVLPIPALDGGRLFVTLLFRGMKKPLTPRLEEVIHGTGFALLMILFVLITIVDVNRFL